jgi:hypothetical protein
MIFAILWSAGCKDEIYQPLTAALQITVEDTRLTEADLQVKATVEKAPWKLLIKRNGQTAYLSSQLNRATIDTIIYDNTLSPNQSYVYKAYYLFNLTVVDSSLPATTTTMDTTSGNYAWQMFTLGGGSSDGFRDVAIISDTSVWAVGQIFVDTVGSTPALYSVAHWNGNQWLLSGAIQVELWAIFAFSDTDIWVGSSAPYHWDGKAWQAFPSIQGHFNGYIKKIWGMNSSSIYIVGTNGAMAHYDGAGWQQLESGTTLDIQDIWGGINSLTGNLEILAVAADPDFSYDREILKISGTTVTTLSDSGIQYPLNGVWFSPGTVYCVAGDGFYQKNNPYDNAAWTSDQLPYPYYLYAIRGIAFNDMVAVGDFGEILHFDGVEWRPYNAVTFLENGWNLSVAMKGDLVVAVGMNNGYGVVTMGKRQPSRKEGME